MAEPKLRFPEFKGEWKEYMLNDYATKIFRVNEESDAPIMMISAGNGFIYQADRYKKDNTGNSLKKYIELHKEEFAYNHGYSKAKIYGSVFMLTEEQKARVPFVYHCFSIENGYKPFFAILLNRTQLNRELVRYISSTARQDGLLNISFDDFMKVKLFVPAIDEQRKIAEVISSVDNVIASIESEVALWEEKKKGVMQKIFSQEVRFRNEDGSEYPEWEEFLFMNIATLSKDKYNPNSKEQYRCIELDNIEQRTGKIKGYVNSSEQNSIKNVFHKGDVLFGKLRPYLRKYAKPNFDGVCSSEIWVLHPNKDIVCTEFLYHLVASDSFIAAANISSGTKMPRADWKLISSMYFEIPSLVEQQKIADCLSSIDKVIEIKKQKCETWKNIKKGLLQQMFV